MLHFGSAPRWKTGVKIIQVKILISITIDITKTGVVIVFENHPPYPRHIRYYCHQPPCGHLQHLRHLQHPPPLFLPQIDVCPEELHNSVPATVAMQVYYSDHGDDFGNHFNDENDESEDDEILQGRPWSDSISLK